MTRREKSLFFAWQTETKMIARVEGQMERMMVEGRMARRMTVWQKEKNSYFGYFVF